MEMGIICVCDFMGIVYECLIVGRKKGWDSFIQRVCERCRQTKKLNNRLSYQQIHIIQFVVVTCYNNTQLSCPAFFALLSTDLKTDRLV